MNQITVRLADWDSPDGEAIRAIRRKVFIVEQNVPEEIDVDGSDTGCEHVLAFDHDETPVGTGRLAPVNSTSSGTFPANMGTWFASTSAVTVPATNVWTSVDAITAAVLLFGTLDLPSFGIADQPVHLRVAPYYLEQSIAQTSVPNVVTSVLASYRGFDTLGETTVIFTAGIAVLMLLKGRRRKKQPDSETGEAAE